MLRHTLSRHACYDERGTRFCSLLPLLRRFPAAFASYYAAAAIDAAAVTAIIAADAAAAGRHSERRYAAYAAFDASSFSHYAACLLRCYAAFSRQRHTHTP